jgi:hypothetical protein
VKITHCIIDNLQDVTLLYPSLTALSGHLLDGVKLVQPKNVCQKRFGTQVAPYDTFFIIRPNCYRMVLCIGTFKNHIFSGLSRASARRVTSSCAPPLDSEGPGYRLLVGCGSGRLTLAVAPWWQVIGIDRMTLLWQVGDSKRRQRARRTLTSWPQMQNTRLSFLPRTPSTWWWPASVCLGDH